jgi:hypothetical protein
MDSQSLKDLARRWIIGIWDEGKFDLIRGMTAEGWVFRLNQLEPYDADTFPKAVSLYRTAFPDMHNTIDERSSRTTWSSREERLEEPTQPLWVRSRRREYKSPYRG